MSDDQARQISELQDQVANLVRRVEALEKARKSDEADKRRMSSMMRGR